MRPFRTTAPTCNVQCDRVDGVRYLLPPDLPSQPAKRHRVEGSLQGFPLWQFQAALLPLGYPASVITKIRRTIERRLIRALHLVESSIPKFRIGCPGPARDGERPTSSRCDLAISGEAVVDRAFRDGQRRGLRARRTAPRANALRR
jgi:hypothetical protein